MIKNLLHNNFSFFTKICFFVIMVGILFSFFYFQHYESLSLVSIRLYQQDIQQWILHHTVMAVSLYLLVFIVLIACTIPCATVLALLGGFFFGNIAILYAITGTILGGSLLFLFMRTVIGARIANKSTGWIKLIETGFKENAFNYILTLRLVPIFPCWITNMTAGVLNVPFKIFLIASVLGILPSTVIYVMVGRGIDKLILPNENSLLNIIFTPAVFFPLIGLALLSLFPVFYKHVKK